MLSRLRNLARALPAAFDKDDALLLVGLLLLIAGLWTWSRALALIAPGLILVWVFLPSRPPFVEPPAPRARRSS
jgi:fatty acid desaturase